MSLRRTMSPAGRRIWRVELVLTAALVVVLGGIGYYRAAHLESNQRFSHCTIVSDAILVLDYYYGVGDEVVTWMRPEDDRIVVGLRVHGDGGTHIAIGLSGTVQYFLHSGLEDRPVAYDDGRELNCRRTDKVPR
jgi:hypothetical protein